MIKDIISKKGNYAFLCKDKNHFKVCVRQTHDEGIVFSKSIPFGGRDLEPFVEGYDYIIENYKFNFIIMEKHIVVILSVLAIIALGYLFMNNEILDYYFMNNYLKEVNSFSIVS